MILITGAAGQLGKEVQKLLDEKDINYVAYDSKDLDIKNKDKVNRIVREKNPDIIFHCAAYTAVDNAEDEGKEINRQVNIEGTENIARAAETVGATIVYISTDYVFDGKKKEYYLPDDSTNPQNEYGKAKLEGEKRIQKYSTKYYIIRTSWVFGEFGNNFVFTMLKLAEKNKRLKVVNDQIGRPTWTRNLAEFMIYLVQTQQNYGVYHLANEGYCSWYEFSKAILKDKEIEIFPVGSEEYLQKAKRPEHSVIDLEKTKRTGFLIPTWKQALDAFFMSINE